MSHLCFLGEVGWYGPVWFVHTRRNVFHVVAHVRRVITISYWFLDKNDGHNTINLWSKTWISKYLVNQRIYVIGEVLISDVGPRYP